MIKFITTIILLLLVNFTNGKEEYKLCKPCISFIENEYPYIYLILTSNGTTSSSGISGTNYTCESICSQISSSDSNMCNELCSGVGIQDFKRIIKRSIRFDNIFMCQQFNVCPYSPDPKVHLIKVIAEPESGPQGTNFTLSAEYFVLKKLGATEIDITITTPSAFYSFIGQDFITERSFGFFKYSIDFPTTTNSMYYPVGEYEIQFQLCNEGCGNSNTTFINTTWLYFNVTQGESSISSSESDSISSLPNSEPSLW